MISASNELAEPPEATNASGCGRFWPGLFSRLRSRSGWRSRLAVLDAGLRLGDAAMNLRRGDLDPSESRNHGSNAKTAAADLVQAISYGATAGTGAASAIGISGANAATTSVAAASTAAAPVGKQALPYWKPVVMHERACGPINDMRPKRLGKGDSSPTNTYEILAYAQRRNRTMAKIQGALTVGGTAAATSAGVGIAMAAGATVASEALPPV